MGIASLYPSYATNRSSQNDELPTSRRQDRAGKSNCHFECREKSFLDPSEPRTKDSTTDNPISFEACVATGGRNELRPYFAFHALFALKLRL